MHALCTIKGLFIPVRRPFTSALLAIMTTTSSFPPLRAASFALALSLGAACATKEKSADTASAAAPAAVPAMAADSMGGMAMSPGMQMTGDPDRDFLRMMSDHHKGLIAIAHLAKDRASAGTARTDAATMDAKQDQELDRMVTMLEKDFKDPYGPKIMPEHQAMADDLKGKSGAEFARTFYQDVIKHHQEAIVMIDGYTPKAKNATIRSMAEKMKTDQSREIAELEKKVAKL